MPGPVGHLEEVEEGVLLVVLGDIGAAALAAHQQAAGGHLVQRLAHRALADAQFLGQLHLARQEVAGPPIAADQPFDQQIPDLLVEWLEAGKS